MPVDVVTAVEVARQPGEVAAYASDPDNAPAWYDNIESVEWRTQPPLGIGSQLAFVARFLGRRDADDAAQPRQRAMSFRRPRGRT